MLLLPQAANRLLRPHQPKLKEHGVSLIESSTTGTSVSSVAPYIRGSLRLISTFLLDAFTTSTGKNLETCNKKNPLTKSRQSQIIRGFSHGQNKDCGNSAIFHIEIQRKNGALHRMVKMYICLRFFCDITFIMSVCCAS